MSKATMQFNEPKDFGYLLLHPNAVEVMTKILTSAQAMRGEDFGLNINVDFWANCDMGFCQVSFDRKSDITRYKVRAEGRQDKDFDDFAEVVAYILGRWY